MLAVEMRESKMEHKRRLKSMGGTNFEGHSGYSIHFDLLYGQRGVE
jgi:hypothetical protein